MSASLRHYVPAEIQALRTWLPFSAGMVALIAGIERLRGDVLAAWLAAGCLLALILARFLLPDGERRGRPMAPDAHAAAVPPPPAGVGGIGARLAAAGALAIAGLMLGSWAWFAGGTSGYDFWSRLWLWAPFGLVLFWLCKPVVLVWAAGRCDAAQADAGLARNKRVAPRLKAAGLHIALLHAVALVAVPVIWIVDVAVSPGNTLGGAIGDAFTLEHFGSILGGATFWVWTRNSLIVALGTTLAGLALAIPAGYAFSRCEFAGRRQSMFLFMLIQMFPGAIILVPYFMVMKTLGLLNSSIGLILVYSVTALPLCVWMLKGFFDTVPRALEEAALLDGCSQLQVFLRIVLPLSLPAVAVTALFSFLAAWNEFLLALVFNTSNEMFTLPVGLASMIPATGQQWGDFAAASILVSVPVVILFIAFQRTLIQGLTLGALKS